MFETAELGRTVSADEFNQQVAKLRPRLLLAQREALKAGLPITIIVSGVDGAGKGEVVHRLNEWLDPRGIESHSFWKSTEEERQFPPYWRFWRDLPGRGRIGIFFWGWYNDPILDLACGKIGTAKLEKELNRIGNLERMLADDGGLVLKYWFHLSPQAYRRRQKELAERPSALRPLSGKLSQQRFYRRLLRAADRAIRRTDFPHAPWHLIEAADANYRDLTSATLLLKAIERHLGHAAPKRAPARKKLPQAVVEDRRFATILDQVDLDQGLKRKQYQKKLAQLQSQLRGLTWEAYEKGVALAMLFEGWDAAGKGGAIRRVTEAIDARLFRVIPVAAPTEEERAHHYLWRFWRNVPRAGRVTIFDRSWYGRVLVERVEGFARPEEWSRAYAEINDFEQQLVEHGVVLLKFWIHISKDEQLRRFREREAIAYKNYKITPEDWRNREKWNLYRGAVSEMVARTSTGFAPWVLVAGNDKKFARIQVLEALCDRLRRALRRR